MLSMLQRLLRKIRGKNEDEYFDKMENAFLKDVLESAKNEERVNDYEWVRQTCEFLREFIDLRLEEAKFYRENIDDFSTSKVMRVKNEAEIWNRSVEKGGIIRRLAETIAIGKHPTVIRKEIIELLENHK